MTGHPLSPEHDDVAREATDRIRATIAASTPAPAPLPLPPEGAYEDEDVS